jgi:hypothetical protein
MIKSLVHKRSGSNRPARHRPSRKAPHVKRSSKAAKRRKRKRFRADGDGVCEIRDGVITWTLPRKLQSLNKLRGWRARYGDTKGWERELDGATIVFNDMSLGPGSGKRLRLEVVRLAPNAKFRLDKVNLFGGIKGLEDALVRLGFLVDDAEQWEDGPWPTQGVSSDKKYWTIVRLMSCQPESPLVVTQAELMPAALS